MIKVLVVEDSPVVREFLVSTLSSDRDIEVIGTASNGEEAIEFLKRERPDVITMDIHMPKINGLDATRKIMETSPTPIIVVSSSWDVDEVATTFRAVEAGALTLIPRPAGIGHPDYQKTTDELIKTVKLMSEVKVVKRWPRRSRATGTTFWADSAAGAASETEISRGPSEMRVVAIGASTGGPVVLKTILSGLPQDFPAPLLIVQHIASGFVEGFVEWLGQSSNLAVRLAAHGERLLPGCAYVAPDGSHLEVAAGDRISLSKGEPENGLRPSISHLFRSIAKVYGHRAVGVLLTGMGKDGAAELKLMREKGAVTIVQDEESSVVYGMPGEAIRLDAALYVLSPEAIVIKLLELTRRNVMRDA